MISSITPVYVDNIPDHLEEGVLYICEGYKTVVHKCCCGCGEEVVTPLSPADWSLKITGGKASLKPSIGNWDFDCRSHYWITRNQVQQSYDMTEREISYMKVKDKADKNAYVERVNRERDFPPKSGSLLKHLWAKLTHWVK